MAATPNVDSNGNAEYYLDKFKDIVAILRAIKEDDGSISWSAEVGN